MAKRRIPRPCLEPGCPELTIEGSYCPAHTRAKVTPSTEACASPWHRRRREHLLRVGPPWACSICGGVITDAADMDLHHVVPAAHGGRGPDAVELPAHRRCNRSLGAQQARPAA